MAVDSSKQWHREVISSDTENTLSVLHDAKLLDHFYLAGRTGLALHFGHRLSRDLDFFAGDLFDEEPLLQQLQRLNGFSLVSKGPHTLHAVIQATKVSFLGYEYPVLFPSSHLSKVAIANPRDIACMKISAIASRGTKRDFVDLYFAARQFGLSHLLQLFDRKYSKTGYNKLHILKSLVFFDDAEKDPMPHMLIPLEWQDTKAFFLQETPRLV